MVVLTAATNRHEPSRTSLWFCFVFVAEIFGSAIARAAATGAVVVQMTNMHPAKTPGCMRDRPLSVVRCALSLGVQHFAYLRRQHRRRERLLQEGDVGVQDAVANDGIIGVTAYEEHLDLRAAGA